LQLKIFSENLNLKNSIIKENKNNISNLIKEHNKEIEKNIKNFNNERKNLINQIEELKNINNNLNNDINSLNGKIFDLNKNINYLKLNFNKEKNEYEMIIKNLINKYEIFRKKQEYIINDINIKIKDNFREKNLLKQQIDFLNQKLKDFENLTESSEKIHDNNLTQQKYELENDFNEKLNTLITEKNEIEKNIKIKK
jgi:uncharacterized coiled-coil protein SlyX